MTERLASLLHDEADVLDIPVPPAAAVLQQGRGLRRRRRLTTGLAVAAAVAVVGTGATVVLGGADDDANGGPATSSSYVESGAYAVGRTVHLGPEGEPTATMDEDVHSLHYTSAGVLVRTNRNGGASDGSGPEHFTLVRPDGTTKTLDVTTEDITVSSDVDQPYLAFSEADTAGRVQAVLVDVVTGKQTKVDVPGTYEPQGWPSPPVSLDGDVVYVGFPDHVLAVDWRTGESRKVPQLRGGIPEVYGSRTNLGGEKSASVIDVGTGASLLSVPLSGGFGWLDLSPDGRWAKMSVEETDGADTPSSFDVYEVSTGAKVTVDGEVFDFGWSPDGHLFRLDGDRLVTCDPATGACVEKPTGVKLQQEGEGDVSEGDVATCELLDPRIENLEPGDAMPKDVDSLCLEPGPSVDLDTPVQEPAQVKLGGMQYES